MFWSLMFIIVVFLVIIISAGSKKYKEHSTRAGEEDLRDWYNNKYRDDWYKQHKDKNKKY